MFDSPLQQRPHPHHRNRLMAAGIAVAALLLAGPNGCPPRPTEHQLAISDGNRLLVVDTATRQPLHEVDRYVELADLAFSPDGEHLAVSVCSGENRIVELDADDLEEVRVPMTADGCPGDMRYSPDGESLAAILPVRRDSPSGPMDLHLKVVGRQDHELDMGFSGGRVPALAYRPGGGELAVAAATGEALRVLAPGENYDLRHEVELTATAVAYTIDGARLLIGTPGGLVIRDAAGGYGAMETDRTGPVADLAVDPTGHWAAVVRESTVEVFRAPDLLLAKRPPEESCTRPCPFKILPAESRFSQADFSDDGTLLAVTEPYVGKVRLFRAPEWRELPAIENLERATAIAFRPTAREPRPVVFVHGHLRGSGVAWFDSNRTTTSFAEVLAVNPDLAIDAFYLELPVHGDAYAENRNRSIAEDAVDIRAAIEGGPDSGGAEQVGILNMPRYRSADKVAVIGYSQGAISSRYYLRNHMGELRDGAVTVSHFVALAAPNHGLGDPISCGELAGKQQLDRARREVCGGLTATSISKRRPCGDCGVFTPPSFAVYRDLQLQRELGLDVDEDAEKSFLRNLNGGHEFARNCDQSFSQEEEAVDGVFYVNLYAAGNRDEFVGGETQEGDCVGRRLARSHGQGVENRGIPGVPRVVHTNFPHHRPTICVALRSVVDGAVPALDEACDGLVRP